MRRHKPWYRTSKDAWFVEINGKQVRLAKGKANETEAYEVFYKLMVSENRLLDPCTLRVAEACDLFLDFSQRHHTAKTYHWYRDYLEDFCQRFGTLTAAELKPYHVSRWLEAHPDWQGGRRCAVTAIKRVFNWAESEGLLATNPIKKVKKPPERSRNRVLTKEEHKERSWEEEKWESFGGSEMTHRGAVLLAVCELLEKLTQTGDYLTRRQEDDLRRQSAAVVEVLSPERTKRGSSVRFTAKEDQGKANLPRSGSPQGGKSRPSKETATSRA